MIQITPELEANVKEWKEIFRKVAESGMSKREWCNENGICRNSFFYWQRRIRELEEQQNPEPVSMFYELDPATMVSDESIAKAFSAHIMIQAGAYQVYIDDSFKDETLARILAVIRDD